VAPPDLSKARDGVAVRPAAARDADADEFITALPDGSGTSIDPHTAELSGGQLQRITIARAMLRDAPVLVLEEPTTGLDAPAARRVIKPLRRLMRGRTTIMITHDLNLAPDADRILVLDDGRFIETGTHHELLGPRGRARPPPPLAEQQQVGRYSFVTVRARSDHTADPL
jgi:ABC-type multidrug transport system fused ATPase/permease subunit